MILVLMNAHPKPWAALLHPARRFATVCLDQASNIADALAFGYNPRPSKNPGRQLRNSRCPFWKSLFFPFAATESPACPMVSIQNNHYRARGEGTAIRVSGFDRLVEEWIVFESSG